jgi:hypothetical protein
MNLKSEPLDYLIAEGFCVIYSFDVDGGGQFPGEKPSSQSGLWFSVLDGLFSSKKLGEDHYLEVNLPMDSFSPVKRTRVYSLTDDFFDQYTIRCESREEANLKGLEWKKQTQELKELAMAGQLA